MIRKKSFLLLFVCVCILLTLPVSVFTQQVPGTMKVPEEILCSKQNQRYQWFAGQRLYGQGGISARVLSETWQKEIAKAGMLHSAAQFPETADWISRGPTSVTNIFGENNYSGRVRGLAIHPQNSDIVYAGAASGGIWKTTDGGESWNDLSFELASCTFGAIAIDPANPDIVYAGTGEVVAWPQNYIFDGKGLFKSTDGGSTWTWITEGFGLITQFADLEVSPHDSNLLLAGLAGGYSNSQDSLDNKGIWRSTDSGLTWNQVLSLESGYNGAYEVAFDPVNPSMAYAGIGDYRTSYSNSGFYMSADSGRTWDKLGTGLPESINRIQFSQSVSNPSTFYTILYNYQYTPYKTCIFKSTDAGTTWVRTAADHCFGIGSRDQGFYDLCLSVDPANSDHVLAGNILLWQTTDGSTFGDFIRNVHFDNHIIRFAPSNPAVIYLGCDGGVYRSEDGGLNWEERNQGLSTLQLYAMSSHPTDKNQMAAGSQDNWYFITKDCGITPWQQISLGGDGFGICYDFEHPDTLYCMAGTSLWKTLDSGDHFTKILSDIGYLTRIRQPTFCMNAQNSQQLTIPSTKVWRSNDGGENWEAITGDIFPQGVTSLCESPVNSDIFVATTYETQIMVSTDGGYIWSDVSCQLSEPSRYISRLVSHPADQNTFFAVRSGYGSGKIFRTTDFGNLWTDVSGNLPDVPYSDLFIDPENTDVYLAANDLGVYGTSDAGQTWERVGNNMPFVVALDFDYFCHQGERLLRIATYGRGVFEIDLNSMVIQSDVQDEHSIPSKCSLRQNYPNPFNGETRIEYELSHPSKVKVVVYDLRVRQITVLVDDSFDAGLHSVEWNGKDSRKIACPSGIYFYRIETEEFIKSKKMVLLR